MAAGWKAAQGTVLVMLLAPSAQGSKDTPPVDTCAMAITQRVSSSGAGDAMVNQGTPHPGAAGGFVLAMRFGSPSQFTFFDAHWTNEVLVDQADTDPYKNADGKFAEFVSEVATEIRGCLPHGCKTFVLSPPTTLKDLFTNTPISSTSNVHFGETESEIRLWANYSGYGGYESNGWMDSGINYDDDQSGYNARVRFGALYNNQDDIVTTNDAIGFGAMEAGRSGVYSETDGFTVGAGATFYPNEAYSVQGTIWIKGPVVPTSSPTTAPSPSPTPAPTPMPTPGPTTAPTVAAIGDPHLVNKYGQRFDLFQPGYHTLIQVPRWARRKADFLVLARATRAGAGCADLYFTEINVSGTWARKYTAANLRWVAEGPKHSRAKWHNFHDVSLKVVHGHTQEGTRYLNVLVRGLRKVKAPVGGLLGEDDHSAASTPSSGCRRSISI